MADTIHKTIKNGNLTVSDNLERSLAAARVERNQIMTEKDKNQKAGHQSTGNPSPWVVRFAGLVPIGAPVVDVACGGGRHGRLFLDRGHPVLFADRDVSGVSDLAGRPGVEILQADFEGDDDWPLADRQFGAVIVTNYLWRPILPKLVALVGPGGFLIYETFAEGNEAYGRPRNPDFLLRTGELMETVRGHLDVIAYEQCIVHRPAPAVVQHIAARRQTQTDG
jgi:SAM-dependent methyltransferase